ncbi:hypothetical protein RHGRI_014460 [Rhododendron griersonianum]|uniref:Uncharacterized protein n=1 Tax=Rhododendron griersonianum TaxID=479676 RepID=A0AAV6K9V6_9ERIC|nr:hypothetical protein RHGRI_014460 [Rhododendron griersonianum]
MRIGAVSDQLTIRLEWMAARAGFNAARHTSPVFLSKPLQDNDGSECNCCFKLQMDHPSEEHKHPTVTTDDRPHLTSDLNLRSATSDETFTASLDLRRTFLTFVELCHPLSYLRQLDCSLTGFLYSPVTLISAFVLSDYTVSSGLEFQEADWDRL